MSKSVEALAAVLVDCLHEEHGLYNLGKIVGRAGAHLDADVDEAARRARVLYERAREALLTPPPVTGADLLGTYYVTDAEGVERFAKTDEYKPATDK